MSRKPHARLAHQNWRDPALHESFRADWARVQNLYGIAASISAWTPRQNELNWRCIVTWRALDAFGTTDQLDIPHDVLAAFEAILLSDVAGESLPVAYAYADEVKASWAA